MTDSFVSVKILLNLTLERKTVKKMETYDRNVPYNQLPPLPPATELYRDEEVLNKLMTASRRLAELKGLASTLPNQSIFVNTIALREAKASSAIENIFTTDDELYRSLSYQEDDYLEGPAKEILHYREALWKGFQRITAEKTLTIDTVVDVYREVKRTHDSIRPYQTEVAIKKRGWGSLVAETVYTPPRGKGVVEKKMADLLEFLNDDTKYPIDSLLKMVMAHYQFEAIHPFRDGNGRTGRILCILYLIQKQLLDLPILYLSAYILQNKDDYYWKLNGVTGALLWKPWIMYMLEAVSQTVEYTTDKIIRIKNLMDKTRVMMLENSLPVGRMDIPKLFEQPYIRPRNLLSDKIKSVNTAKKYLSQLESLGMLTKEKVGKEFIWFNTDLMTILSD
ncbi:MAG: Fic family protein [Bacteroidales bacterium]|nr:Fic family protein [Bacteroidales bacterium]